MGIGVTGRIDVHFHTIPPFFREAVTAAGLGPTVSGGFPAWSPELSLGVMDRHGIDVAITSVSQPGVHFGDDAKARALGRRCNEHAAELMARWPRRFGAFAALPLPDVQGAIAEAAHALDVLNHDGVCLLASYGERFLGDAHFDPLLELLNERGAVAFIHPNFHPSSRALKLELPGFMMEFLFDTTRAAVNLAFGGALDRFPRIRFILAHAGGTLPYIAWRLSMTPLIDARFGHLKPEQVLAQLRRFWYDTGISAGPSTLGALREVADPARVLFGSDWPYAPEAVTARTIEALAASELLKDKPAVDRGNALKLFPRFSRGGL